MKTNKIIVANPKDKEHIKLFKEYKEELDLNYLNKKEPTEIKEVLFNLNDNSINNIAYIYGHDDIKQCHMYFENYDFKNISFLNQAIDYAEKTLEMNAICFHIPYDNKIITKLEGLGFDLMGTLDNEDTIIMEKYEPTKEIKDNKRR